MDTETDETRALDNKTEAANTDTKEGTPTESDTDEGTPIESDTKESTPIETFTKGGTPTESESDRSELAERQDLEDSESKEVPPPDGDTKYNVHVTPVCLTTTQLGIVQNSDEDDVIICGCCKQTFLVFTVFFEHKKEKICEMNDSKYVSVLFDDGKYVKSVITNSEPVIEKQPVRKRKKVTLTQPKPRAKKVKVKAKVKAKVTKNVDVKEEVDTWWRDNMETSPAVAYDVYASGKDNVDKDFAQTEKDDDQSDNEDASADIKIEPDTSSNERDESDTDWKPDADCAPKLKKARAAANKKVDKQKKIPKSTQRKKRVYNLNHQCERCGKKVRSPIDLRRHMLTHTGEKPYKCHLCVKAYSDAGQLKIHIRSHTGERPFLCPECGKSYSSFQGVFRHQKEVHTDDRPFKCTQCGHASKTKRDFNHHLVKHTDATPFMCTECGQRFKTKNNLRQHELTHKEKKYHCSECDKRFLRLVQLKSHVKRIHKREKKHACTVCHKTFFEKKEAEIHMRRHVGDKRYQCTHCGMTFYTQSELKKHLATHSDEKPHPCPVCGQRFRMRYNMTAHLRKLHQEKNKNVQPNLAASSSSTWTPQNVPGNLGAPPPGMWPVHTHNPDMQHHNPGTSWPIFPDQM